MTPKLPLGRDTSPAGFRTGYLKLKSVLHDRTTKLPAFPLLFDRLRAELDQRRQIGVLHVEALELELVETLYGWQVVDRIMTRTAATLRSAIGCELPESTLLALNRVAGDRLLAFVPEQPDGAEVDANYLAQLGSRICERLQKEFGGDEFAGLCPTLIFRAGHAMLSLDPFYRFERRVYAVLDEAARFADERQRRREASWGEELQRIIRERTIQTLLQPVVELESGTVIGFEAFVRGPRDSLFEMPRAMFAMSGRLGVDVELDRLCLTEALRTSTQLDRRGKFFVNVLPEPFQGANGGGQQLDDLFGAGWIDPADLVLEFAERSVEAYPEQFGESTDRLRKRGCGVALDNVGTGTNSRETIRRARPDFLKLDLSLVRGIQSNLIKQEVLNGLVELSEEIGATVIAEGIESEEEAATLSRAGARYGQGYLYAVPAPASSALLSSSAMRFPHRTI